MRKIQQSSVSFINIHDTTRSSSKQQNQSRGESYLCVDSGTPSTERQGAEFFANGAGRFVCNNHHLHGLRTFLGVVTRRQIMLLSSGCCNSIQRPNRRAPDRETQASSSNRDGQPRHAHTLTQHLPPTHLRQARQSRDSTLADVGHSFLANRHNSFEGKYIAFHQIRRFSYSSR
jgi:hypothetical protein